MKYLSIICLCYTYGISCAQPSSKEISYFQSLTDSFSKANKVPGIVVGVLTKGGTQVYTAGYAVPATKTKYTGNTIFEIGSITKTFTAYILQKVLTTNNIPDTASIATYLPDSVSKNKAIAAITYAQLLNHTSGLQRIPSNMDDNATPYDNYTVAKLYSYLSTCSTTPNGSSQYSNTGMGVAGILAQSISHKTYTQLLQDYIIIPFEITKNHQTTKGNKLPKATGYFTPTELSPYWQMDALAPAGGLKMSTLELLNYLKYMLQPTDSASAAIIRNILQPTVAINAGMDVCKAWHTIKSKGKTIYWHNGGTYGFSTFCAMNPSNNTAVVVAVNQYNQNKVSDILGQYIIKYLMR